MFGSTASKPESPPSPVTGSIQVREPLKASEPLSWVPARASLDGLNGLTEIEFICSVPSPALSTFSCVGILLSHMWQSARLGAVSPRESHWLEASAHWPLARSPPPAEATKNSLGLPGTNGRACWSGCIDSPPTSPVTPVQVAPASVDIRTRRPLEGGATCGE